MEEQKIQRFKEYINIYKNMSIKNDVKELNLLNTEIKRLSVNTKNLKNQAKEVEKRIISYLNSKEQHGVKYSGTAVIVENKLRRQGKKKTERENDAIRILTNNGVHNANSVLEELLEARRGDNVEHQRLKIKKIQDF
jgi:hypothetical protein